MKIRHLLSVIALASLPLTAACSGSGGAGHSGSHPSSGSSRTASAADEKTPEAPHYITPTTADFLVEPKIKTRQCFGSAGCNVTVQPDVTWIGLGDVDPDKSYEITYQISGDDSGPVIDTLTLSDGTSLSYHPSLISTDQYTSTKEITIKVTGVEETY
jgi:hypothetical protein